MRFVPGVYGNQLLNVCCSKVWFYRHGGDRTTVECVGGGGGGGGGRGGARHRVEQKTITAENGGNGGNGNGQEKKGEQSTLLGLVIGRTHQPGDDRRVLLHDHRDIPLTATAPQAGLERR